MLYIKLRHWAKTGFASAANRSCLRQNRANVGDMGKGNQNLNISKWPKKRMTTNADKNTSAGIQAKKRISDQLGGI